MRVKVTVRPVRRNSSERLRSLRKWVDLPDWEEMAVIPPPMSDVACLCGVGKLTCLLDRLLNHLHGNESGGDLRAVTHLAIVVISPAVEDVVRREPARMEPGAHRCEAQPPADSHRTEPACRVTDSQPTARLESPPEPPIPAPAPPCTLGP